MFVFFSDGILDARNEDGEMFGRQRVEQIVARAADKPADWVVDSLFKAVLDYAAAEDPFDDQTVVVIRVKGDLPKRK
jgi:phosphoserine phosphatase RsbU/P